MSIMDGPLGYFILVVILILWYRAYKWVGKLTWKRYLVFLVGVIIIGGVIGLILGAAS